MTRSNLAKRLISMSLKDLATSPLQKMILNLIKVKTAKNWLNPMKIWKSIILVNLSNLKNCLGKRNLWKGWRQLKNSTTLKNSIIIWDPSVKLQPYTRRETRMFQRISPTSRECSFRVRHLTIKGCWNPFGIKPPVSMPEHTRYNLEFRVPRSHMMPTIPTLCASWERNSGQNGNQQPAKVIHLRTKKNSRRK